MTSSQQQEGARQQLARALLLLQRYSNDITEIAEESLGGGRGIGNNEISIVLAVRRHHSGIPSGALADELGLDRSLMSRYLSRLEADGLVRRTGSPSDARVRHVRLARTGATRVVRFSRELGDYFSDGAPAIKEVLELLDAPMESDARPERPTDPLAAAAAMSAAGSRYVADATVALLALGVPTGDRERYVLGLLAAHPTQRPSQIADELNCDPSAVTLLLDQMERAGLVSRRHEDWPGDRRTVLVTLTAAGQEAAHAQLDVLATHAADLSSALMNTLRAY